MPLSISQTILTGLIQPAVLLRLAIGLTLYCLPSLLAFSRGHRKFFVILVLNVLVVVPQFFTVFYLFPSLLVVDPQNVKAAIMTLAAVLWGPGWLMLLVWSLWPGEPDPRLLRAQQTKTYDTIVALPLILWFGYGALQLRGSLAHDAALIADGTATLFIWVQFVSLMMAALFSLLLVYLLVVRDRAVAKSKGVLPRFFGVIGTFMGVSILQLPVAALSLPVQILAAVLIGIGSLGSVLVLWRLGKSFSIMPEARKLVTSGPYAWARHPLYAVEMITIAGTALQFAAPWSWIIAAVVLCLQWIRSHFEEQVLAKTFPEYAAYRVRTKRFIPGVI